MTSIQSFVLVNVPHKKKSAQTRGVHSKNSSLDPKRSFRGAAVGQTNILEEKISSLFFLPFFFILSLLTLRIQVLVFA